MVFGTLEMEFTASCYTFLSVACTEIRMDIKKLVIIPLKLFFIGIIIFIIYQVLLAIFGGTWESENIIVAGRSVIFAGMFTIIGFLIQISRTFGGLEERMKYFEKNLFNLEQDFKVYMTHYHTIVNEINNRTL